MLGLLKIKKYRYCCSCHKDFTIYWRFLVFLDISKSQTAEALLIVIMTFLEKCNLSEILIISQSYNGASVMASEQGVASKKKNLTQPF